MTPDAVLDGLAQHRVVAIVRASSAARAVETAKALRRGGIGAIEIAFTTPDAASAIRSTRGIDGVVVGAGTVRSSADLEAAVDAGAAFVASPATNVDVLLAARNAGILAIPGVLTPTEIERVLPLSPLVKLFPAGVGGPALLRALRGPYPSVRFMPTGGVSRENVQEWFAAGAFVVGAGSDICPGEAIDRGDFDTIAARAAEYVEAAGA
jgi:2-dehydro-3-deoxyphosphogluconate aldolase / (4S)-4-hydroxy-2-oxoglutarate aldolase